MHRDQRVSIFRGAVFGLIEGFLVTFLVGFAQAQSQGAPFRDHNPGGLRRCVVDERSNMTNSDRIGSKLAAENWYDTLGLYTEGRPLQTSSKPPRRSDINVFYWNIGLNRTCMKFGEPNEKVETFLDFNLQKILSGFGSGLGAPTPDILVLDNCRPGCSNLPSLFTWSSNQLRRFYSSGSRFNCEFVPKSVRNSALGTCLFWSDKLRKVPSIASSGVASPDQVVDWVPVGPTGDLERREKYRKFWNKRLMSKLVAGDPAVLGFHTLTNFSPRIFETHLGKRIHIIPANVNRNMGTTWWNVLSLGPIDRFMKSFQTVAVPRSYDPESMVHNQVERYASALNMYFSDVQLSRRSNPDTKKDDIVLMLGNFEIPSRICSKETGLAVKRNRASDILGSIAEDVMVTRNENGSLCDWPTSAVVQTSTPLLLEGSVPAPKRSKSPEIPLPQQRDLFRPSDYVGLQTHRAYFRPFSERSSWNISTAIVPISGSEYYPLSVRIFGD